MGHRRLRIWAIATFTVGIAAVIIRSIWQIVVIPTPGTMLIFIPIIFGAFIMEAIFILLILRPSTVSSLPFKIGVTVITLFGMLASVVHYIRFILSPLAEHILSKVMANLLLLLIVSSSLIIFYLVWWIAKRKSNGQS